jgi:hypothetical protein
MSDENSYEIVAVEGERIAIPRSFEMATVSARSKSCHLAELKCSLSFCAAKANNFLARRVAISRKCSHCSFATDPRYNFAFPDRCTSQCATVEQL